MQLFHMRNSFFHFVFALKDAKQHMRKLQLLYVTELQQADNRVPYSKRT